MSANPEVGGPLPSPCINICRMNEATGWCEGCFRSIDEIAFWSVLDEEDKRGVWQDLARRRAAVAGPDAAAAEIP